MGVHNVEKKDMFQEAIAKPALTVVDFFATWCPPCKAIAPKVVEFSDTYTDVKFLKVDVDELSEVASEWSVTAMPTFLLFKNGEKVGEVVGANARALEAEIKKAIET